MLLALLINLPFLIVYICGLVISASKRRFQKQPASLAMIAYGTLIFLWVARMAQIGWIFSAQARGIGFQEYDTVFSVWGYAWQTAYYFALATLLAGVFIGRKESGGTSREPAIIAGLSIALTATGIFISRSLTGSSLLHFLAMVCEISGMIGILTALYGWRNDQYPKQPAEQEIKAAAPIPIVGSGDTVTGQANPVQPNAGMFEKEDFIPFITGVMGLGGLLVVPIVWGQLTGIKYIEAILPSLLSCGVFVYAHDERGNFSLGRFFLGFLFLFLAIARAATQYGHGGAKPMFMAGGLLGYVIMLACGWAGIAIARFFRKGGS